MWHGTSVYYGYLRGPVLLTTFADCLLGNCHNLLNNLGLLQLGFEPPTFCMRGKCSYRLQQWFRLLNTILHFKFITMKHKQCSTHIKMLFVFSLSRSPVPPCQFPGSDIYTNMIAYLYLSTNYEEFVNDERFAIFISTLNCKLHTFSCYFLCQNPEALGKFHQNLHKKSWCEGISIFFFKWSHPFLRGVIHVVWTCVSELKFISKTHNSLQHTWLVASFGERMTEGPASGRISWNKENKLVNFKDCIFNNHWANCDKIDKLGTKNIECRAFNFENGSYIFRFIKGW